MLLIMIEATPGGTIPPGTYHAVPYRLASSIDETVELMQEYLRLGPDRDALPPEFFAVYSDAVSGVFDEPTYYNPATLEIADDKAVIAWLQETGRC